VGCDGERVQGFDGKETQRIEQQKEKKRKVAYLLQKVDEDDE
jgi:hypothetical protein